MTDLHSLSNTDYMLTTVDNPYDPFTQFNEWFGFDTRAGYNSSGLLARIVMMSDELSPSDQEQAIRDGIDEIVAENVLGLYKKVFRNKDSVTKVEVS